PAAGQHQVDHQPDDDGWQSHSGVDKGDEEPAAAEADQGKPGAKRNAGQGSEQEGGTGHAKGQPDDGPDSSKVEAGHFPGVSADSVTRSSYVVGRIGNPSYKRDTLTKNVYQRVARNSSKAVLNAPGNSSMVR